MGAGPDGRGRLPEPGLAFNSLAAVERGPDGRTNPMVNAGAIATASLAPGASQGERWEFLCDGLWKTRHGYVGLP